MLLLALGITVQSQGQEHLSVFENLMGKTWFAEGEWGNNTKFKQEIEFKYDLGGTLVISDAEGFTNQEQTTYGPRNHGIRKFDKESNTIKFWEFDVFGGVTTGSVEAKGKDFIYTYSYGASVVTDYWEYVNDNTYNFTVGNYVDGQWKQIYLKTKFEARSTSKPDFNFDHQSLVVTNLMKTGDFYKDVFGFEEIPHPENKPGFRWFNMNRSSQLHLIKKDFAPFEKNKSMHLCLAVDDLESFVERLVSKNIDFYDWPGNKGSVTDRADGVKQIYIQDPEGYWIEINTAVH